MAALVGATTLLWVADVPLALPAEYQPWLSLLPYALWPVVIFPAVAWLSGGVAWVAFFVLPAALLLSNFAPWLITPLLMLGGSYLCFEGAEKVKDMEILNPTIEWMGWEIREPVS